jgi:hypothetical protein
VAKEKMMRYALVIAALILAACTEPEIKKQTQTQQQPPISPTIEITAPREAEAPKAKEQKAKPTPAPSAPMVHPCAGIETGDPEADVRAKLDCIKEHG